MVFWNELEIYKKNIGPSTDAIVMMMHRERMPSTGAYDTAKSNTSSMDDPYTHVLYYRSYWFFNISCCYPKIYPGYEYFLSGGNKESRNGALNVVSFHIFSSFQKIES